MTIEAADKAALDTVGLLSHRLQRIEFLLTGSDAGQEQLQDVVAQGRDQGVATRLTSLESSLAKLASESANVQGLLTLRKSVLLFVDVHQLTKSRCCATRYLPIHRV